MLEEGRPGRLIRGRYRLIAEIGSGGMGRVWEARDEQLGRPVAVKEVQIHVASAREREDRLARAEREGRNAAALADHPNVVTVYDVVVEDGVPWTVMQLVRGRSLRSALEAGPVEPGLVARIAAGMLSALGAVHGAGIVHRDVKPGNIMLADDGQILLTDFGIAKGGGDETVTSTGGFLGSLEYTAPERAEGAAGDLSADLFSLGVTLFHAVEGDAPFHRETKTGILTAILLKPLPPMTRASGPLATLIRALTIKNPADRPTVEQAQEILAGTRAVWEPLAAADTVDNAAAFAGTQNLPTTPKPRPPWETMSSTSTSNTPRPALMQEPDTVDRRPAAGRRNNRALMFAGAAVAAVGIAAGIFALVTSGSSGTTGSSARGGAQGLAGSTGGTATSSTNDAALAGQGAGLTPVVSSPSPDLSPSLQSLVSTLASLPGGASSAGPGQTTAPGQQTQPATTTHTTTAAPPPVTQTTTTPPKTLWDEQAGASGAATFTGYHNASGPGTRLQPAQWVKVSCKVKDGTIASVNPDGYWYRIQSSPWNNAYYAPANSFKNGDPWTTPIPNPHNTDFSVPDC